MDTLQQPHTFYPDDRAEQPPVQHSDKEACRSASELRTTEFRRWLWHTHDILWSEWLVMDSYDQADLNSAYVREKTILQMPESIIMATIRYAREDPCNFWTGVAFVATIVGALIVILALHS